MHFPACEYHTCQLVLSTGQEGTPGNKNTSTYPGLCCLHQGLREPCLEVLQTVLFLLVLLPLPPAQEERCWEAEPLSRVSLGALGWPSPTLGSVSWFSTVQSLAQLSAVPSKLSLRAKGLYLKMYGHDRKESLFLFLSPCKKFRKLQEGVRKTCTPLLCGEILEFKSEKVLPEFC